VHALVAISSLQNEHILDSDASHHMDTTQYNLSSLKPCTSPPILMGDDTLLKFCGQCIVDPDNGCF
jgi:hypothetical protein